MKTCRRCNITKRASEFGRDARYRDGLASWCRDCFRENNKKWAMANRDSLTQKAINWRARNPDKVRAICKKHNTIHKARRAEQRAKWAKDNPEICRARTAKRKAAKAQATPPWADMKAISKIYADAARIQSETGVKMHVDHIIPLRHKAICGLHCETNLRIITAEENVRKKNKWEPEAA